jgi:hypothetical protein
MVQCTGAVICCTFTCMKNSGVRLLILFAVACIMYACTTSKKPVVEGVKGMRPYVPASKVLYDSIVYMDSIFFTAYNNCGLAVMSGILSDSIEFYHDQGGLSTSKQDIMKALEKNICGKVTRELLPGSIEVYPIKNYGAVQLGMHRFHNNQEPPGTPSYYSKFVQIWHRQNGQWKITRVVSLH